MSTSHLLVAAASAGITALAIRSCSDLRAAFRFGRTVERLQSEFASLERRASVDQQDIR